MPEYVEVKIMSEFINDKVSDKKFNKFFHVEKGNIPKEDNFVTEFTVSSNSNGKELLVYLYLSVSLSSQSSSWKIPERLRR